MKSTLFSVVILFASIGCSKAQKTEFTPESLKQELLTSDQNKIPFADALQKEKGKTLVIEVWASWCGDCVKAMPQLKKLQESHPEANYMFISMDKVTDKWLEGIKKHDLKGSHYFAPGGMKGAFGASIDLDWIPRYIIIDKFGKIVTYRAIEKDFEAMDQTLNKLKS
ncbi:TlpA family protein disulfide reductase [Flavobacterium silvaticum]|uniref:TlpA family protein disulfide reductase n=1 Tax=Flavobacterium silvaticum TaxID=1852020 RepID=A0A972FPB9_9FLAO|nr:TlpA disulfide reductase family protein [Flavobacterium silvaticum]NMH26944.1 TlpA family protein disulfide reductase [Flavobacterium silvaticum]